MVAGYQGIFFGYAIDDTVDHMPLTHSTATRLGEKLPDARKSSKLWWLRYDSKTQVTIEYMHKPDGGVHPGKVDMDVSAGDQGIIFGHAIYDTVDHMPLTHSTATSLREKLSDARKFSKLWWLRYDLKTQVTIEYLHKADVGVHLGIVVMDVSAGDQGIIFGYAIDDTVDHMPLTHSSATRLGEKLSDARKSSKLWWLRYDLKTQVTIEPDGGVHLGKVDMDVSAGDQGIIFGYAINDTVDHMPLTHSTATRLIDKLSDARNISKLWWLRQDLKSPGTIEHLHKADGSVEAYRTATKDNMVAVDAKFGFDSFEFYLASFDSQSSSDNTFEVIVRIIKPSPDIAVDVHVDKDIMDVGACDQGIIFSYAIDETVDNMPLTHSMATCLDKKLTYVMPNACYPCTVAAATLSLTVACIIHPAQDHAFSVGHITCELEIVVLFYSCFFTFA
jgi:S-adenosylmethionine synthetase